MSLLKFAYSNFKNQFCNNQFGVWSQLCFNIKIFNYSWFYKNLSIQLSKQFTSLNMEIIIHKFKFSKWVKTDSARIRIYPLILTLRRETVWKKRFKLNPQLKMKTLNEKGTELQRSLNRVPKKEIKSEVRRNKEWWMINQWVQTTTKDKAYQI